MQQNRAGWLRCFADSSWSLFLPLVLFLPTLFMGLAVDDYFHQVILRHLLDPLVGDTHPLLDLFAFLPNRPAVIGLMKDWGVLPWWTSPDIHASFLRPVTALSHMLDQLLWPTLPFMQHLHSLAWLVLAGWAARNLFRIAALPPQALALATLFFLVEDAHAMPASWIANRNVLIAFFFGCQAIAGHIQWQRGKARLYRPVLFLSMSLLSAEAGLCAMGYVLAWSLVYARSWPERLRAVLPYALLIIVWRIAYNALGYGAFATGIYNDPIADPFGFFGVVLQRLPVLLLGLLAQLPTEISTGLSSQMLLVLALCGVVLGLVVYRQFRPLFRGRPEARFWGLGMLFAAVPVCATLPMNRLLFFPGLGFFALLGLFLSERERPTRHLWFVVHGPVALVLAIAGGFGVASFGAAFDLPPQSIPANIKKPDTMIYITGAALPAGYTILKPLSEGRPYPGAIEVLAHGTQDNTVRRVDAHTLAITAKNGWLHLPIERVFRSSQDPIGKQRVFHTPRLKATLVEMTPDGRPKTVHFRFKQPLDNPGYRWMCFYPMRLVECQPPAIGEQVEFKGMLPW